MIWYDRPHNLSDASHSICDATREALRNCWRSTTHASKVLPKCFQINLNSLSAPFTNSQVPLCILASQLSTEAPMQSQCHFWGFCTIQRSIVVSFIHLLQLRLLFQETKLFFCKLNLQVFICVCVFLIKLSLRPFFWHPHVDYKETFLFTTLKTDWRGY